MSQPPQSIKSAPAFLGIPKGTSDKSSRASSHSGGAHGRERSSRRLPSIVEGAEHRSMESSRHTAAENRSPESEAGDAVSVHSNKTHSRVSEWVDDVAEKLAARRDAGSEVIDVGASPSILAESVASESSKTSQRAPSLISSFHPADDASQSSDTDTGTVLESVYSVGDLGRRSAVTQASRPVMVKQSDNKALKRELQTTERGLRILQTSDEATIVLYIRTMRKI